MKKIVLFLIMALSLSASAQETQQYLGATSSAIKVRGRLYVDSILYIPKTLPVTSPLLTSGAIRYQGSDSAIYVWTGTQWILSGSRLDTTVISTKANAQKVVDDTAKVLRALTNSSANIYNTSGTLTGPRTVTGSAANYLAISGTDLYVNGYRLGRGVQDYNSNTILGLNTGGSFTINSGGNTLMGRDAGRYLTDGYNNSYFGWIAGGGSTQTGYNNSGLGGQSLWKVTSGRDNTAMGFQSMMNLTTGIRNQGQGSLVFENLTTGSDNVGMGILAGGGLTMGSNNTFIGNFAGSSTYGGFRASTGNVFIGYYSGYNDTASNKLIIHNSSASDYLITGDFAADTVRINGSLGLRDVPADGDSTSKVPTTAWVKRNAGSGGGGGGGTTETASNGLNKVGNDIRLGGNLTGNTEVNASTNNLSFYREGLSNPSQFSEFSMYENGPYLYSDDGTYNADISVGPGQLVGTAQDYIFFKSRNAKIASDFSGDVASVGVSGTGIHAFIRADSSSKSSQIFISPDGIQIYPFGAYPIEGGVLTSEYSTGHAKWKLPGDRILNTYTSNHTADENDRTILVDATSGNVTITLPLYSAPVANITYTIKKIDATANTVTIDVPGTDQLEGSGASIVLTTQFKYYTVQANHPYWWIIGNN